MEFSARMFAESLASICGMRLLDAFEKSLVAHLKLTASPNPF